MKLLTILTLFLFSSCASYVQSVHRQINNEQRLNAMKRAQVSQGNQNYGDRKPIKNPISLGGSSANNLKNNYPNTRRQYNTQGTRRYKASDLIDDQSDGSLWSGKNSESFLFVNNNLKNKGDIVIVEVLKDLKDKIQAELKRNYPDAPTKKNKKDTEDKKDDTPAAATAAGAAPEDENKVYDKISSVVIEQVNQDYLLIRGRKEVMFKKYKRYFEIQALVSQKDVSSRDSVASIKLLEPKIKVLRY